MATFKTDFKTAQDALSSSRTTAPSARPIQQDLKYAVFTHVVAAAHAANDIFQLGWLNVEGAVIIPELSRVTVTKTTGAAPTACSNTFRLESVTAGGTAVVEGLVTASAVTEAAVTQPFVKLAVLPNVPLVAGLPNSAGTNSGSYLQIVNVTNTTDITIGEQITVEVAYRCQRTF